MPSEQRRWTENSNPDLALGELQRDFKISLHARYPKTEALTDRLYLSTTLTKYEVKYEKGSRQLK